MNTIFDSFFYFFWYVLVVLDLIVHCDVWHLLWHIVHVWQVLDVGQAVHIWLELHQ